MNCFLISLVSGTITRLVNTLVLIYQFLKLYLSGNKQTNEQTVPSLPSAGSKCRIIPGKDKCAISSIIITVNPIFLFEDKFDYFDVHCVKPEMLRELLGEVIS